MRLTGEYLRGEYDAGEGLVAANAIVVVAGAPLSGRDDLRHQVVFDGT